MGKIPIEADEDALQFLAEVSDGDARRALNALEVGVLSSDERPVRLTRHLAQESVQRKTINYDADGDIAAPTWILLGNIQGASKNAQRSVADIRANFEALMAHARDAGAPLFALCDQDDVWRPEKLARLRAALESGAACHGARMPLLAYSDLAWIDAGAPWPKGVTLSDPAARPLATRQQLELENRALRQELLLKNSDILLLGQFKQENARLRELLGSPLRQDEHKMVTQVISTGSDPYSDQVVIDKGSDNGVYEGQPVISDKGVVGQVVAVAKVTSRVLLICDASHALPIQVLRNDIRVIAAGSGCADDLQLEHLPNNTDIRVGDVLVTSGLGGRFPEGYPVAVVSSVKVDNQRAYTVIQARPTAGLQRLRYLLLLWGADRNGDMPLPPDEVHRVANERLMQMMPQVLPPAGSVGPQLPAPATGVAPQAVAPASAQPPAQPAAAGVVQ